MAAPAAQYKRLATRYAALTARAKAGDSLVPDTTYADFLRDIERQSHPHAVPTSPPSLSHPTNGGGPNKPRPLSANAVRERAQQSLDESNKQLKAIEDHMWQHRQEERSLKRAEMDVLKQRKNLERTMKTYENKLVRRQEEEVQAMMKKEDELVAYQQKALHEKESGTKERTRAGLAGRQRVNAQTKKFMKTEQEMSWRYQNLLNSLQMKKNEMEQLSKEFEKSIRAKEEEQHRLKRDLAQLAISLNMEAGKKRQMNVDTSRQLSTTAAKEIQESLQQSDQLTSEEAAMTMAGRRHENKKRNLEQAVQGKQETLQARHRQEGRRLMDIRAKQQQNLGQQKFTRSEAEHVHLDMMGREIEARIQEVEAKKSARVEALQRRTEARNRREMEEWTRRMGERENEAKMREHAQRLKQLSHVVAQYDSREHALYAKVREANGLQKKQVQVVEKLQEDLEHLKKRNAVKLKSAALEAQRAEVEMQQKIIRETAELTKAANIHAEATHSLVAHRQRAKEDRRMLTEERKEHQRRSRIANRTALPQTM